MPSKIDGSKYFYWRNRYISTGNLRAFDLMTKHYAAMDSKPVHDIPAPVGKRHADPIVTVMLWYGTWDKVPIIVKTTNDHIHVSDPYPHCAKNRFGPNCHDVKFPPIGDALNA